MSSTPVEVLLNDLQLANPARYALVIAAREANRTIAPQASVLADAA